MKLRVFLALSLALSSVATSLSDVMPVPVSLRSTMTQEIGKTTLTIDYSRPNAKGRALFGSLVPYGEVWRTGANQCTSLATDTEIQIAGETLPAGRYALFTIPQERTWTVILNAEPDQFGAFNYDSGEDVLSFSAEPVVRDEYVETFEIRFAQVEDNAARLELRWGNTVVAFPVSVTEETNHQQMMKDISELVIEVDEPHWANMGEAARYYVRENVDLEQAVEWYRASLDQNANAYWLAVEMANVLRTLDRTEEAKAALESALKATEQLEDARGTAWVKQTLSLL